MLPQGLAQLFLGKLRVNTQLRQTTVLLLDTKLGWAFLAQDSQVMRM